ncbi:unnamed protein product [Aphanomyces euteiches]
MANPEDGSRRKDGLAAQETEEDGSRGAHSAVDKIAPEMAGKEFAVGLYMAMWPKVEKCDSYVTMLLDTQAQLQQKIKELTETLTGSEDADNVGESPSPLVDYAMRLREFPNRVQVLQTKLEGIRSLLNAVRAQQRPPAPATPSEGLADKASV